MSFTALHGSAEINKLNDFYHLFALSWNEKLPRSQLDTLMLEARMKFQYFGGKRSTLGKLINH